MEWEPGEAWHRSTSYLCLSNSTYCLPDTWRTPGIWAVSKAFGGVGYMNEAWSAAPAAVGCCCLCSGQKADEQMVQGGSWWGTDPDMVRSDVIVQGMGCRNCLELPPACIALHESGMCPNITFTAQRTNMDCVVWTQHFWNVQEVLELLSRCCVNKFLCRASWRHRVPILNRYFCLNCM